MPLTFTPPITPPSGLASPAQINVVANPMGQIGCATGPWGEGPIDIEGLMRVVVTNGDGLTTTGKTFIFDYVNVGSR